ncbi:MAG TPA: hypothetical protein VNO21_20325, partial [Polyangiaceae bacterium]|nr:hypothetical protein [Polyangiaceae bacterium]
ARVQLTQVEGLERVAKLGQLSARDEAQRERLDAIAKEAESLKEELRKGMEKRDAQDKIARLREQLAQERLSLGEGEERAGLESAVSKLEESETTKRAGKALGDHDLVALDREMEKLANQREKEDRQLAKKKLEEASDAAKKGGAREVGKALDEEKKRMDQRAARTDALRELADAMKGAGEATDDVKTESEALDRQGTDKAAKSLASAMGQALEKLTPEERKRLADKLRSMAKQSGTQTMDADRMKDMAGDLSSPEGQKKLADALKDLAKDESSNERQSGEPSESARQRALDDAQKGAEGTERQLEGQEQPSQGPSEGTPSGPGASSIPIPGEGAGAGPSASAKDSPGHGGTHDRGTGDHRGSSGPVDAQSIKSRAHGSLSKGQTMPGSVTTFLPGKAGGTANVRGSGDLRVVGPSEIDGVERSDVPEEYREHVRQYFQP